MVRATTGIREGALTRRVRITAPSAARVLEIAGATVPDRNIRLSSSTGLEPRGHGKAA